MDNKKDKKERKEPFLQALDELLELCKRKGVEGLSKKAMSKKGKKVEVEEETEDKE